MKLVDDSRWNTHPEQRLLLWAAQPRSRRACLTFEGDFDAIDWVHFRHLVQRNRVVSPVADALREFSSELPEQELARYQEALRLNAVRTLRISGELIRILGGLSQRGIEAMPLKGVSLAHRLYGNTALRDCGDIDLLVRRDEVVPAIEALQAEGYTGEQPVPTVRWVHDRGDEYHYTCSGAGGVTVELHWALDPIAYHCPVRPEDLLDGARTFRFGVGEVRYPDPDRELLFLCVHGGKHQWSELRWVCDIAHCLASGEIDDWAATLRLAEIRKGRRTLLLGIGLAAELFQLPLPKPLEEPVQHDSALNRLIREATLRILAPEVPVESRSARLRFHIALRDSWVDRAHYFVTSVSLLTAGKLRGLRDTPRRIAPGISPASVR